MEKTALDLLKEYRDIIVESFPEDRPSHHADWTRGYRAASRDFVMKNRNSDGFDSPGEYGAGYRTGWDDAVKVDNEGDLYLSNRGKGFYDQVKEALSEEESNIEEPEWPSYIPQYKIDFVVSRLHVGTSDEKVADLIRKKLSKSNGTPEQIQKCVDYALYVHHENLKQYNDVMSGNIGR